MKETLRFSRLVPIAARVFSHDSQLGGHVIPKDVSLSFQHVSKMLLSNTLTILADKIPSCL